MSKKDILKVNTNLEILSPDDGYIYRSIIQGVSKDSFTIVVPVHKRIFLHLYPGDRIDVTVLTSTSCYRFTSQLIEKTKEKNIPLYRLKLPNKIKKIERRNYVRLDVGLQIDFKVLSDAEKKDWQKIELLEKAYSIDLSAGGVQIVLGKPLEKDTILALNVPLEKNGTNINLRLHGKVVRCIEESGDILKPYKIGIQFLEITEREKDKIFDFIFSQMRKKLHLLVE